ncbi:MAG: hypothetical protein PHF00_13510, partial [Elusimicrobia bacterium]|nr:hypothetical protein [Elusimicrobiota bacterium]
MLAGVLAAASLCACASGKARPFFPIGIFCVVDAGSLAQLRKDGFNAAQTYLQAPEFLAAFGKAARKAGMRVLANPSELLAAGAPPAGYPPAAWYLYDEPDVNNLSPRDLRALHEKVRAWDRNAATAFVVGDGRMAGPYRDCGDVLMVDWYPVPHLPLESAGEHVRMAVEAAGEKPVWAVLQAMNWKD